MQNFMTKLFKILLISVFFSKHLDQIFLDIANILEFIWQLMGSDNLAPIEPSGKFKITK